MCLGSSVNATTRDFEPISTNMTFARLVLAATTNDALPESPQVRLPPRQTAHALVQHYMDNIYSLFPCFLETSLLTALDDIYQKLSRGEKIVRSLRELSVHGCTQRRPPRPESPTCTRRTWKRRYQNISRRRPVRNMQRATRTRSSSKPSM